MSINFGTFRGLAERKLAQVVLAIKAVTDALGTAATKNTGTTSGTIPLLGASGLPAVGGSLLTGLTAAQIGGLGTAATEDTGTTSGTIPLLGASGLPAVGGSLLTGLTAAQISDALDLTDVTIGVEASNAIPVTVTVVDNAGAAVANAQVQVELLNGNMTANDSSQRTIDLTTGTALSAVLVGANSVILAQADASGVIAFDVTDKISTYAGTVWIRLTPAGGRTGAIERRELTFT